MKLSEQWLREWVNTPLDMKQLAEQLTLAGLEVESVTPVAGLFSKVVIGKIINAFPHPNASRLQVCQVDIGGAEPLSIVCGAANARFSLKVAVACLGAKLPGDLTIKETKLRGELSQGMLCSSSELGLTEESTGILELPIDAPIGKDLHDYLQLFDQCIDIHFTPNRSDCLSVKGLARELAALNDITLKVPPILSRPADITDKLSIKVTSKDDCPHYLGRIIRGINPQAKTPIWLSERLRRSGFRSIHPVVDVTNYILLELGQPLHAFDLAHLKSQIIVRRANEGEKLKLLDGKEVALNGDTLVIADEVRVQAIAGVMGGLYSSVSETTTAIFLESAFFNPHVIAGRARHYNLNSESAYRFERGVDPELASQAIDRATQLLIEIVEGQVGAVVEVKSSFERPSSIKLRQARVKKILGISLPEAEIESILSRLGMTVTPCQTEEKAWKVIPPTWRFDINLEIDLIEELARIHGYSKIPALLPSEPLQFLPSSESKIPLTRLRDLLVDRDYHEAITYSFTSPQLEEAINPEERPLTIQNPISNDLSVMRSSLWPGLLNAARDNHKRQQLRVRLFETGLGFRCDDGKMTQKPYLAAIATGDSVPEQWGIPQKPLDFFNVKSDIEALFRLTKQLANVQFIPAEHSALHPGQSCQIVQGEKLIGYFGALHPALLTKLDLTGPVYLFEISLLEMIQMSVPCFEPLSKFPAVRRDISFWVDEKVSAQAILQQVKLDAGNWLNDVYLFDVFHDQTSKKEMHSLALALLWQHPSRTLVDTEIDDLLKKVIESLKQHFVIQLRK